MRRDPEPSPFAGSLEVVGCFLMAPLGMRLYTAYQFDPSPKTRLGGARDGALDGLVAHADDEDDEATNHQIPPDPHSEPLCALSLTLVLF